MTTAESVGSPPSALKVLSLNVWGLAYISKARQFRLRHIADRIAQGDWDVIALQEIWVESQDWKMLQSKCAQRLPYSKFFYSGAFGSGLAILSRFPIVATHTHPYSLNGQPIDVGHGDWFVGKAAGCVTLDLGGSLLVDVYDTHVSVPRDPGMAACYPAAADSRRERLPYRDEDCCCWRRDWPRKQQSASYYTVLGTLQAGTEQCGARSTRDCGE